MSKYANVKDTFTELLSNNAIEGRININVRNTCSQPKTEMSFNEIIVTENVVSFYDDPDENRAECVGTITIELDQIDRVVYHKDVLGLEGLYGAYDTVLQMKDNSQILVSFNMKNGDIPRQWDTATEKQHTVFDDDYKSFQDDQNSLIDAILSHKGCFLININGGDFVEEEAGFGFESYNLVFTSVKPLRSNELLSFDNHEIKPVGHTDKNVPIYPMDFSTNFYIEKANISLIEELNAEEYSDVFEYPTKRIFNLQLTNESVLTIGLH